MSPSQKGFLLCTAAWAALLADVARAVPEPCPFEDDVALCAVEIGETSVAVTATSLDGGAFELLDWIVGGVPHLFSAAFELRRLAPIVAPVDLALESATADGEDATIELRFLEAGSASLEVVATFVVSEASGASRIDETVAVTALDGAFTGRLYIVSDFDLNDTPLDDSIAASANGAHVTQIDGDTIATVEQTGGPVPTGFQVSACCQLDAIVADRATFPLSGATLAPGPDDFQSALAFDTSLAQDDVISVSLRRTLAVPEPALGALAALLTLTGVARRRWTGRFAAARYVARKASISSARSSASR